MWPNPQETADLVTFTEEILNEKLHFLCSESNNSDSDLLFSRNGNKKRTCFIIFLIFANFSFFVFVSSTHFYHA